MSLTKYEAYDDGYLKKVGSTYTAYDYVWVNTKKCLRIENGDAGEQRAYKRFIMDMGSVIITSAILYWYLVEYNDDGTNTNVKLEQISDYGTLDATAAEFTGTVIQTYADVMTPATAHPGWVSQDVTAEMEASKADPYVAFRWVLSSEPAVGDQEYYIAAYEETSYKAYLVITYTTGWQHRINGVSPAGVENINAIARTTGIDEVNSS